MAYANLLDSILDDHRQYGTKKASAFLRDSILEPLPGPSRHYAAVTRTSTAHDEDSLNEASMAVSARHKAAKVASATLTIPEVIKFAVGLPTSMRSLSVQQKQKVAFAARGIKEATARLQRLANKSAAQMAQDGATKLSDYLDAGKVPMWAKQARADYNLLASLHTSLNAQTTKCASSSDELIAERSLSDAEVGEYIHKLLNEGVTPNDVEAKLSKLAELQGFSHGFAADKLKHEAGIVGYAYMEPGGGAMGSCTDVYQRQNVKLGGVRAHSVRQITACTDCTHFKKEAGSKRCRLYGLPVIANKTELMPIINNLTKGASDKKAELVKQANRQAERPSVSVKQASSASEASFKRNDQKTSVRTSPQEKTTKVAAERFTVKTASAMHQAGENLNTIFATATANAGAVEARIVIRSFIAGLKGTKTKVALTQIDCSHLKGKLASSNGIMGAAKCSSCTYRKGMHCGLTGGTLLAYPGMDRAKTNHRIAAGAPEDGLSMMKEFEMVDQITSGDIEIKKPDFADVQLTGFSKVEL